MNSLSSQRPRSSPRCWALFLPMTNGPARWGGGEQQRRILIPSERRGGQTISRRFRTRNSALREPPIFLRYNFWYFVTRLILVITVWYLPSGKCTDEYDTDWPLLRIPQPPEGTERLPAWWGMVDFPSICEAEAGRLSLKLTWGYIGKLHLITN